MSENVTKWASSFVRALCCGLALVAIGVFGVFYVAKLVALNEVGGFGLGFLLAALVTALAVTPLGIIVVVLARRLVRRRDHDVLPDVLWAVAAPVAGLAGLAVSGIFLYGGF
ncbi:hypothetical protein [Amycolatopsis samaneae]|uniref:Major facilitator superfamily (MFS) profile domain-containing protein n=1 Tax=Amycolatopsis samaneae TaxID=664691 RepID=A0ABW5GJE9_9PSEU